MSFARVLMGHLSPRYTPSQLRGLLQIAMMFFLLMGSILRPAYAAVPPNDNFANATVITGSNGTLSGTPTATNVDATVETGEPEPGGAIARKSVWYAWTPPTTAHLRVSVKNSDFDAMLSIYTGSSLRTLTEIDDIDGSMAATDTYYGQAGIAYYIRVDGYAYPGDDPTGLITLQWTTIPAPPNDNFANAAVISGSSGTLSGTPTTTNVSATKEPGEPDFQPDYPLTSVWYVWTAPSNAVLQIGSSNDSDFGSTVFEPLLEVYTGNKVDTLTEIATNHSSLDSIARFRTTAGSQYFIRVWGNYGHAGSITLRWSMSNPPPNDNFADAAVISGANGTLSGTPTTNNTNATLEPGEPETHWGDDTSVWFSWTAPTDGVWRVEATGSQIYTTVAVYTGTSLSNLTGLADDRVTSNFKAKAGTKYYIVVNVETESGPFTLSWSMVTPPPNDDFANAAVLSGTSGTIYDTPATYNYGATSEPGEPIHSNERGHTIWFAWTAPSNGLLKMRTLGSGFYTMLDVYAGSGINDLTRLPFEKEEGGVDDQAGMGARPSNVRVRAGRNYHIVIDGYSTPDTYLKLTWDFVTAPPNDYFEDAVVLSGPSGTLSGTPTTTNVNASAEDEEGWFNWYTRSVWYKWTAPYDSVLRLSTAGSNFEAIAIVYTGNSLDTLQYVTSNSDSPRGFIDFPVTAGTTYHIAVFGWDWAQGLIKLDWTLPAFTISDATVTEGTNSTTYATFTVSRVGATTGAQAASVNYATADGTAKQVEDYITQSGTLNFAPGETSQKITIEIRGDGRDEDDETFKVNLSGATGLAIGDGQGIGIIIDNDATPQLSISDVTLTEGNSGTRSAAFIVKLSAASGKTVTVNAIPSNGTATASKDYTAGGIKLTFAPGEVSKTYNVPVISETLSETDENFFVLLSAPVNAGLARARAIGTIKNDDAVPGISVADISLQEGHFGTRVAVFTIKLLQPSGQIVKVNYATAVGTATADVDYTAVPSTQVAFGVGATTALARVVIKSDVIDEPNETFKLNLSGPLNANLTDGQAICTINDDDPLPSLSIANASVVEGNSGTKTSAFTVTLTGKTSQAVSVNYATSNGSASADIDYVAKTSTLNFAAGETAKLITVTVKGDTTVEGNETFFVLLSTPVNAAIGVGRGTGTITNDDTAGVEAPEVSLDDDSK